MVQIDDVPLEILEYIIYLVSPYDDLRSCRLVCRKWYLSCLGVVKKRMSLFYKALKAGVIEWSTPSLSSNRTIITQRYSHSACIHDSCMYIFGGCTTSNTTFNDLWKYHLGKNEWTRLLTTGTYPSPKAYATMVTWNNNLILFGGWTHPSLYPLHQQWVLFNEFHLYDIFANRWTQFYFEYSPPPTAGHTSTIHDDILVVFGGLQKTNSISSSSNDIYFLNLINRKWYKPLVSSVMPLPRYGHSQLKIDERHLLIMSGCGGSNKLYTDVWLLTLPQNPLDLSEIWQWDSVEVQGVENMPSQIWYNPATRIGDHIVIFCSWDFQGAQNNTTSGKMHQLLVPGTARIHSSNNRALNAYPIQQQQQRQQIVPNNQNALEVNVNGQRGNLRNSSIHQPNINNSEARTLHCRVGPSVRPNASSDRNRMLQVLSRMEKKIKTQRNSTMAGNDKLVVKPKNQNTLVPHLLSIDKVLSNRIVSWLPVTLDKTGQPPFLGVPPSSCLLYSLLNGRGHLVMFGGIPNDVTVGENHQAVTNKVHIISAPSFHVENFDI